MKVNFFISLSKGDGLYPMLFNCILEKLISERETAQWLKDPKTQTGLTKFDHKIKCLAFAHNFAIFSETNDSVMKKKQKKLLIETAEKEAWFTIIFDKSEFMTDINTLTPAP